jgi:hypothetical protein
MTDLPPPPDLAGVIRDLIDRCVRAEIAALIHERRAREAADRLRRIAHAKKLERVAALVEAAAQADMTLTLALPEETP